VKLAQLRGNVDLLQFSGNPNPSARTAVPEAELKSKQSEFRGEGLDLDVGGGSVLRKATSVGAAQILLTGAQTTAHSAQNDPLSTTLITASQFHADFAPDNRISKLTGSAPVKIVSATPGQPDRISTSDDLLATFSAGPTQALQEVIQTGNVQLQEGQRIATANRATLNAGSNTSTLSGAVRYKDAANGAALTSNLLTLNSTTGETVASGDVKTTYAQQKGGSTGGVLPTSLPVHATADQMTQRNSDATARFAGKARLWQGGNIIQAPTIDFNRNERTLEAQSQGAERVSSVFVQADKSGKQVPVDVTADRLHYDDTQRKALFDGGVVLRSADSTLRAERAVVLLRSQSQPANTPKTTAEGAPGMVQSIDAAGNVLLQQPGRRASGARLVYTADEEKFVLTGTPGAPPSIFDAEHGQVTGVSLTFFNRDDRVLVDSSNSKSISQSRLKK
jgi:lipopolysaccharide export system protein LptA